MPNQIEILKQKIRQGRLDLSHFRKSGLYDSRKARILEANIPTWELNLTASLAMQDTLHIKHADTESTTGQPIISLDFSISDAPTTIEKWLVENPTYSLQSLLLGEDLLDCQYGFVAQVTLNTPTVQEDNMTTESTTVTPTETPKPKTKRVRIRNRKSKAAATPKVKVHTLLFNLINLTPAITRTAVLADTGLRAACLTPKGLAGIKADDALETKRWGRKINRFIRQIRRDGHDVIVTRSKDVVTYTIAGTETEAAPEIVKTPDASRDEEESNQLLSFDSLMADLDDDPNFPIASLTDVTPEVEIELLPSQTDAMAAKNLLF